MPHEVGLWICWPHYRRALRVVAAGILCIVSVSDRSHSSLLSELRRTNTCKSCLNGTQKTPTMPASMMLTISVDGSQVTRAQAQAFYEKIQFDRYGPNWRDNPYRGLTGLW
jgi:hypothetical protein